MSDAKRPQQAEDGGEQQSADRLLPLVYDELRRLAQARLEQEKPGQTLQATALVHEAYLRLVGDQRFENRGHFFAAAAEAMRRILIDNARRKRAEVHGGDRDRVDFAEGDWFTRATPEELINMSDSLDRLAIDDAGAAELAKLRLFTGMSVDEAAECRGVSHATAYRQWAYARAWLIAERGS